MADEQWDLMSVTAIARKDGVWELSVVEPPNFQSLARDPDSTGQGDQGMKLVQSFGEQGWQLVSIDHVPRLDGGTEQTYWLKRRVR